MERNKRNDNHGGSAARVSGLRNRRDVSPTGQALGPTNAESVLMPSTSTTKAGLPRRRMQWTTQLNEDVMRSYYESTKLETMLTGYRTQMHALFISKHPELSNLTEQRIIDQKRSIMVSRKITDTRLQQLKSEIALKQHQEVTQEVEEENEQQEIQTNINPLNPFNETFTETQTNNNQVNQVNVLNEDDADTQALTHNLRKNIVKWKGTEPNKRPKIPKLKFSRHAQTLVTKMNDILGKVIEEEDLEGIQCLTYCAAVSVLEQNQQPINPNEEKKSDKKQKPKWQNRLERKIEDIRSKLGRLTQYNHGNRSAKLMKKLKEILHNKEYLEDKILYMDTLKQKLAAYSARLKRYRTSAQRKEDNRNFQNNEKGFYRNLNDRTEINIVDYPSAEEISEFWKGIWSQDEKHNEEAEWIKKETDKYTNTPQQSNINITETDLKETIAKTHNWKAPGADKIHNYWYKYFPSIHKQLAKCIEHIINNPEEVPKFITEGTTYIIPKNEETSNPANYRPITCLSTLYKIITSVITTKIYTHLDENQIMTEEQKGCRKHSQGCKEQLTIDTIILKQAEHNQRNLHMCYIDYQKAFDSIPHSWLIQVLQIYKIHPRLIRFLSQTMKTWRTKIILSTSKTKIETEEINITTGIYQGDSLSALWFCLALNPLSNALNNSQIGFQLKHQKEVLNTISHLFYVDDLKLYAPSKPKLEQLIHTVEEISNDIHMKFGLNKCKTLHMEKGKWIASENIEIGTQGIIESMTVTETYKYLGVKQNTRIDMKNVKAHLTETFKNRITDILKTHLNSKNITKAINTYAIPTLTYSFGIINWTKTDLEKLNRTLRILLTKHCNHHPKACVQRVTIPRQQGGRGFLDIEELHYNQIERLRKHFIDKTENPFFRAIVRIDTKHTPLQLAKPPSPEINFLNQKHREWESKEIHGRYKNTINQEHIDKQKTFEWLKKGQLFPETEGFVIAIQDQTVPTRNYRKYIIKEQDIGSDKCRKCNQQPETIEHIICGCPILAGKEYTDRHNNMAKIIHSELTKIHNITKTTEPYFIYKPQSVLENNDCKIYWDNPIITDKTIIANRPDITLTDKRNSITYLIDIAIPGDHNIEKKYKEKMEKYAPLAEEIKRIWNQEKVIIIPLIIGATGTTPKTLTSHLQDLNIPSYILHNIQKATIINTCSIVRRFLQ